MSGDVELPKLPEGWSWSFLDAPDTQGGSRWYAASADYLEVYATIGESGIEVVARPMNKNGVIPWKVLLAVKDRAIAEARNPADQLRARADDLRPEDRFVTGDRVRYVGDRSRTSPIRNPHVGAEGTVTGFSTPKHGYEHVKGQSVLVTWDEESARPGITIEGRETMVESYELEAMEVH